MKHARTADEYDLINPYISLADIFINFTLILIIFGVGMALAYGGLAEGLGGGSEAYVQEQERLHDRLLETLGEDFQEADRLDPAGTRRYIFGTRFLRRSGADPTAPPSITSDGLRVLDRLRAILSADTSKRLYRRIRIEGHAMPAVGDRDDDWRWEFSLALANRVAERLRKGGGIPPNLLVVSGRGGQAPLDLYLPGTDVKNPDYDPRDSKHMRVEIVIEYAGRNALGTSTK